MYIIQQRDLTPRLRVRSDDDTWGYEYTKPPVYLTYYANGAIIKTYGTPVTIRTGSKKKIIDYKPIVFRGPPRLNPVQIKSVRTHSSTVTWDTLGRVGRQGITWTGPLVGSFIPVCNSFNTAQDLVQPIGFDVHVAEEVLQKVMAKLSDPAIAANEYLFEWKQVINLLKDPFRTSVNLMRKMDKWSRADAWIYCPKAGPHLGQTLMSFRTRRTLSPKRASKQMLLEASNRWLQYRYGILPLFSDIATVFASLVEGEIPHINRLKVEHAKARLLLSSVRKDNELFLNIGPYAVTANDRSSFMETYHAKVYYQKRGQPSPLWSLGLHPRQWLDALWNAVPWSFVGDWLINVDQWLKACTVNPYISIRANCVTRKIAYRSLITEKDVFIASYGSGARPLPHILGDAYFVSEAIRREINLQTSRDLYFSLNWSKPKNLLTALALIIGLKGH